MPPTIFRIGEPGQLDMSPAPYAATNLDPALLDEGTESSRPVSPSADSPTDDIRA